MGYRPPGQPQISDKTIGSWGPQEGGQSAGSNWSSSTEIGSWAALSHHRIAQLVEVSQLGVSRKVLLDGVKARVGQVVAMVQHTGENHQAVQPSNNNSGVML